MARKRSLAGDPAVGDFDGRMSPNGSVLPANPLLDVPSTEGTAIKSRKAEHVGLAAGSDVQARESPGWEDVRLVHDSLPELSHDAIDLRTELLGRALRAPLVIAGMTGGHEAAPAINAALARAAERHGLAMGVGSQRAALVDPTLSGTYSVAREQAPSALLIANIGAAQLVPQGDEPGIGVEGAREAVEMISADALAVHLNFLEESVQPEGNRNAHGCLEAIASLSDALDVPVLAKETGGGLSRSTALRLRDAGVAALDVGGSGGTSFAAVESRRAAARDDDRAAHLGELLRDWGLPTAVAVVGAGASGLRVVATGGVRSGLDAAKALALGASAVGVGLPLLRCALEGQDAVDAWIERFLEELRTVLFLTGARTPDELRSRPLVVLGRTQAWVEQLGYGPAGRA
jgi:isopentenyl-diphosphate Delta-isomerase